MIYRLLALIATVVVLAAIAGCDGGTADDPNAPKEAKPPLAEGEKIEAPSGPDLNKGGGE